MISQVYIYLPAHGGKGPISHTSCHTQNGRTAFRFVRLAVRPYLFLFLDRYRHCPLSNMVMRSTEIFSKFLHELWVVFFPKVHQFRAFK